MQSSREGTNSILLNEVLKHRIRMQSTCWDIHGREEEGLIDRDDGWKRQRDAKGKI